MRAFMSPDPLAVSPPNAIVLVIKSSWLLTHAMKNLYRRQQRQYINPQSQVGNVTPGNALLISVCLLELPMLGLATVQLATMYSMKPINQCHVNLCHMIMTYPRWCHTEQHSSSHGHPEWISKVKHQMSVILLQHLCFPQPNSNFSLWSWKDGWVGGSGTTGIDEWRCRD